MMCSLNSLKMTRVKSLVPSFLLLALAAFPAGYGSFLSACALKLPAPESPLPDSLKLLHTLPRPGRYFTVDKLQQVYLVDSSNTVYKYSPDGREVFHYNNNTRGRLAYIDPTDPFNLLLFYPELQSIATLDRTMNETAVLHLFSAGIVNASAAGLSIDNNFWVYDQATFQLSKIGRNGQVLVTSDNLSAQLTAPPRARQLTAQNNMIYLTCPGQGVYVFDNFGQFHQLLPYPEVERVQLLKGKVLLYESGRVRVYNLQSLQEKLLPQQQGSKEPPLQIYYQGNRFYELSPDGHLRVYASPRLSKE